MSFDNSITDACNSIINAVLGCIEGFYKFFYILAFMLQCQRIVDDMRDSFLQQLQLCVKVSRLFLDFLLLLNMGDELRKILFSHICEIYLRLYVLPIGLQSQLAF